MFEWLNSTVSRMRARNCLARSEKCLNKKESSNLEYTFVNNKNLNLRLLSKHLNISGLFPQSFSATFKKENVLIGNSLIIDKSNRFDDILSREVNHRESVFL